MSIVDQLSRRAADAEPPPLDELAERRMIERALAAMPRVAGPQEARTRWLPVFATALVAVALGYWLAPRPQRAPELTRVALPTGDRLVGTDATRFDVAKLAPDDRRVELRAGTLLADVAHVVPHQRFAIATAHLVAIAHGTVFSVETDLLRSRVRVFDGIVEVVQAGEHHLVGPGAMWTSDARTIAVATTRPGVLADDIADAVAHRAALESTGESTTAADTGPATATASASAPATAIAPAPRTTSASVPAPASAIDPAVPQPALDDLLASARAALASGKLADALAICERAKQRGASSGTWLLVTADTLRGLGRASEAAATYERASSALQGTDAFEAGYSAAYLRWKELKEPDAALTTLVTTRVDAEDSPLEERGLALHVRILQAAGRTDDAKPIAQRYLARYPHGELRAEMQALTK